MTATRVSVEEGGGTGSAENRGRRRRRRRGTAAVAVVVILAAAGATVAITDPFGHHHSSSSDSGVPTATARITQGRLTSTSQVSGTLGYEGDYQVMNAASGVYTTLPSVGDVISQGQSLYRVAGKPIVLLYGPSVPLYRDLSEGMSGTDVKQLNADLVRLGYASKDDLDPTSDYFSSETAYALEKLQKHLKTDETGELKRGTAVFVPVTQARVLKVTGTSGGSAGGQVMEVSSTTRQVSVALDATQQSQVAVGDKVTITLPNQQTTSGVVTSVGTVAVQASSGTSSTVTVLIKPLDPTATGRLDKAPVQVAIVTGSADNALAVPVNALLALAGGGYAVEVVDQRGQRHLVPVTVGIFDDSAGTVQISGSGLAAGQSVVVPAS